MYDYTASIARTTDAENGRPIAAEPARVTPARPTADLRAVQGADAG